MFYELGDKMTQFFILSFLICQPLWRQLCFLILLKSKFLPLCFHKHFMISNNDIDNVESEFYSSNIFMIRNQNQFYFRQFKSIDILLWMLTILKRPETYFQLLARKWWLRNKQTSVHFYLRCIKCVSVIKDQTNHLQIPLSFPSYTIWSTHICTHWRKVCICLYIRIELTQIW